MRSLLLSAIPALLVFHSGVAAQTRRLSLEPGARVRVTRPCGPSSPAVGELPCRVTGRVVEVGADSLVVEDAGRRLAHYSLATIDRLSPQGGTSLSQVSAGPRTHGRSGALVGTVAGGAAAYLTFFTGGSTATCDRSANQDAAGSGACLGILALGGLAGAGLGALVGGFIRTEGWHDLPMPEAGLGVSRSLGLHLRIRLTI